MTTIIPVGAAPLLAAELCYFGDPRDAWELLLLRARQLGARAIVSPAPWAWHAPRPGTIDVDGTTDPRRDLVGFVQLCGRLGFQVVLAPGPFAAAGAPEPVAAYLAAARRWIAALSAALLPLQAPHGPIAALQVGVIGPHSGGSQGEFDREADIFAGWYGSTDPPTLAGWLREDGWTIPLEQPVRRSRRLDPAAALVGATSVVTLGGHAPVGGLGAHSASTLIRPDGSARPGFWRAKMTGMLVGAAGADLAGARAPADVALGYAGVEPDPDGDLSPLAPPLEAAGIAFDLVDLDTVPLERLLRYTIVLVPADLSLAPATANKLAECSQIILIDDDVTPSPHHPVTLSRWLESDFAARLVELVEDRGGSARYAWADTTGVELSLRYGAAYTYLFVSNRRPAHYSGTLAYRAPDGTVLHLHLGVGAGCAGVVLLRDDEVAGAAIDGDASEGGWLARGLSSSAIFNNGAGGMVACGAGLLLTASQSGRFQIRRAEGWAGMAAHRLLLSGALLPAQLQTDATHLLVPYVAEDERGQTDLYVVQPAGDPAPPYLRDYLAALLVSRAATLRRGAALAASESAVLDDTGAVYEAAAGDFSAIAWRLEDLAPSLSTLAEYRAAWQEADDLSRPALAALERELARAHGAFLEGALDPADYEARERQIARVLNVIAG